MSKHEIMQNYINAYVEQTSGGPLGFNFTGDSPDEVSFLTQYADKDIKKYVRIGAQRAYGFAVVIAKNYSSNADDINLKAMELAQEFNDWVEIQNLSKNYPDFGEKCQVQKIEAMQNMPNLMGTNEDMTIAYYMLQCKVTYFEKY